MFSSYIVFISIGAELSPENDTDDEMENIKTQRIDAPKSERILCKELQEEGLLLDYANDQAERLADRLGELEVKRVFQRAKRVNERVDRLVSSIELRQRKLYERRRRRLERKLPRTRSVIHQNQPTSRAA
jgi:hypothetical protein